jgi:exoribonuclease R
MLFKDSTGVFNTFDIKLERHFIVVKYNLHYDEADKYIIDSNDLLMFTTDEIKLINTLQKLHTYSIELNNKYKYIASISSSHEMVQVYMIFLNQYIALLLTDKDVIYRNQTINKSAEYSYTNIGHASMNVNYYTHFTSPIRRIVDQYVHKILINEYFSDTKTNSEITKLDITKINEFELNLKKVTTLWNYLTVSHKIKNGHKYNLEFCGFTYTTFRVEFKLLEYNIFINNKIFYTIVDEETISIQNKNYKLNTKYELPLYIINESKNQYFPKIIIKF